MGVFVAVMFFILLVVGREALGWKGIVICIALWAAILSVFVIFHFPPGIFWAIEALFNIILILYIFGGDINLR